MKTLLSYLNWKKNPSIIWAYSIPLFALGALALLCRAYIEVHTKGDWSYVIIANALLALGAGAFISIVNRFRA
jgi:hypothetical protein